MSGFIVMFSLIKKYQKGAEETVHHGGSGFSGDRRVSMYDEHLPLHDCETTSTPKLTKKSILY